MMEDLSLHILDIAENSVAAGATRVRIAILEDAGRDILSIRVTDNGRGMTPEERRRALDPFFTTKGKRTGLGLPLLAQTAESCGGRLTLGPAPGGGTRVAVRFRRGHIDRPPLTKMAETLMTLFYGHPEVEFRFRHTLNGKSFSYSRRARVRSVAPREISEVRRGLRQGLKRIGSP